MELWNVRYKLHLCLTVKFIYLNIIFGIWEQGWCNVWPICADFGRYFLFSKTPMLSLRPSQCGYLAVSSVFGSERVDVLYTFSFQTEDVFWVSDLMVTSFKFLSRKQSSPTHVFLWSQIFCRSLVNCISCQWTMYVFCGTVTWTLSKQ
jgi:hypothetical protein